MNTEAAKSEVLADGHQKKTRTVWGRREAVVEVEPGVKKTMRFELRADGVHVRRKHCRKERVLTFADLVHASEGQGLLKL